MLLTRLKTKNQVTIPVQIVDEMNFKFDQLFSIEMVGRSYLKLTPVAIASEDKRKD